MRLVQALNHQTLIKLLQFCHSKGINMKIKKLVSKNRDPNWQILRDKGSSGASGSHKNKRHEELQSNIKHKKDLITD